MRRSLLALFVVMAVAAFGCGDDDQAQQDQELEDALTTQGMALAPAGSVDDQQARCAARQSIDRVGADRLREVGAPDNLQTGQLTQAEQEMLADAALDCVDVQRVVQAYMAETLPVSDESAACIADDLEQSGALRDGMVAAMAQQESSGLEDEVSSRALASLTKCLSPADLQRFLTGG